eukprot:TRINITY_DN24971_c0_g1_i1.p1 TRINITY_DN24971_c0_g1~~TRINITY_DN24971_c0_g1_i1.p1  ORF type:complete len:376 (-),score=111.32 TRINITY_DN24971_c0_g1_i1:52-1179(-)
MYPSVFSPVEIPNLGSVSNRFAMAPMTRGQCPEGAPTPTVARYYAKRAEGGTKYIITECGGIDFPGQSSFPNAPLFFGDERKEAHAALAKSVKDAGGFAIAQIWHCGGQHYNAPGIPEGRIVAPSAIVHPYFKMTKSEEEQKDLVPHELTKEEIKEVALSYGRAAKFCKDAGYDGVEIHGAHGYLIHQFFCELTNSRTDEYGGSFENRGRFAGDVAKAVRQAVGPDFHVNFRFSQFTMGAFDHKIAHTPEDLKELLAYTAENVDMFHGSQRRIWQTEFDSELNLAGWLKKLFNKPAMSVGNVGLNPEGDFVSSFTGAATTVNDKGLKVADEMITRGDFDMLAVGRIIIANYDYPEKIKNGHEVVPFNAAMLASLE